MKVMRSGPSIVLVIMASACGGPVSLGGPPDAHASSGGAGSSGTGAIPSGSIAAGSGSTAAVSGWTAAASGSTATGANAANGANGGGTPDSSTSCLPAGSVTAAECPPNWTAAMTDEAAFCKTALLPEYDAVLSTGSCRGLLRYTRFLFDAGPRYCVYDPSTLALRGYYAHDGKAGFDAITCASTAADFDITGCASVSCPRPDASVNASGSASGSPDTGALACGTTTCSASQYCVDESVGPRPLADASAVHFYSCAPIPSTCARGATTLATCACVVPYPDVPPDAAGISDTNNACTQIHPGSGEGFGGCREDGAGHVTLACALP